MPVTTRKARFALWILPLVLVPVAFFASMQWLKSIDRTLLSLATAAAAIFVMSYATYLSVRSQRGLDEVHMASAGFSAQWGTLAGTTAFLLLLCLPPLRDFATALIWNWAGDPGAAVNRKVVVLAMTLAFCGVVVLQTIGTAVMAMVWWRGRQ